MQTLLTNPQQNVELEETAASFAKACGVELDRTEVADFAQMLNCRERLIGELESKGYSVAGSDGSGTIFLSHETQPRMIAVADRYFVSDGRGNEGASAVTSVFIQNVRDPYQSERGIHFDIEVLPLMTIAAPSPECIAQTIMKNKGDPGFKDQLTSISHGFTADVQRVICSHEEVHLDDMTSNTPWGKAMFAAATEITRAQHIRSHAVDPRVTPVILIARAPGELQDSVGLKVTPDQYIAAQLITELKAHAVSGLITPERAKVATDVLSKIQSNILGGEAEIFPLILEWQKFQSNEKGYTVLKNENAAIIASRWIAETGTL